MNFARLAAAARNQPKRAPPVPLEDCDRAVVESALAAPAAGFGGHEQYPDLPSKAAALTYALAKSQACVDGNKRAALILLTAFLGLNDSRLQAPGEEAADRILAAATSDPADRDSVVADLATWLGTAIVPEEGQ